MIFIGNAEFKTAIPDNVLTRGLMGHKPPVCNPRREPLPDCLRRPQQPRQGNQLQDLHPVTPEIPSLIASPAGKGSRNHMPDPIQVTRKPSPKGWFFSFSYPQPQFRLGKVNQTEIIPHEFSCQRSKNLEMHHATKYLRSIVSKNYHHDKENKLQISPNYRRKERLPPF